MPRETRTYLAATRTGRGFSLSSKRYIASVSVCPMPVAHAAPSIPIAGTGPKPKIIIGSRMIFATQPHIMQNIVEAIRPTD